ncbi:MAG: hypothetical protein R3B69_00030 [Candidatus Paceibacterota bacterium]
MSLSTSHEMEFSWREIGVVLFIAQLAYIMFEPIIGRLADRYIGEREMMAVGFLILSASTATLTWFTESSVLVWGIGMFHHPHRSKSGRGHYRELFLQTHQRC